MASAGFHLQHLSGVLDRLFTYAKGKPLSEDQMYALKQETEIQNYTVQQLLKKFNEQIDKALAQLSETPGEILLEARSVGRAQLPSNVLGLLFHAAEHTMRHTGQLLVTAGIMMSKEK
jgi:uncharacterized damage-inducible protein DinB